MPATAVVPPLTRHPSIPRPGTPRALAFYCADPSAGPQGHDLQTKARVAEGLAELLGSPFEGEFDALRPPRRGCYLVPSDTLPDLASARRLGIRGPDDLFGGAVPHAFVATKVISHPLLSHDAHAPPGWNAALGLRLRDAVLPGFSVFSAADAQRAGERLLAQGSVRLKDPGGVGGLGQWVVRSGAELRAQLKDIASEALWARGLVLERNLREVVTHSVGQVQAGGLTAAYHGVQHTTLIPAGDEVYGGSELVVARGGFEQLMNSSLPPSVRRAVEQALAYHRAALSTYRGMFVSRSNYDVVQGNDDSGTPHSGVLEQSWRIGGASAAEVAALRAFAGDASLQTVRTRTCERYGGCPVPAGAWVLFDGVDPREGRLTKYAMVMPDVHV